MQRHYGVRTNRYIITEFKHKQRTLDKKLNGEIKMMINTLDTA